MMNSGGKNKTGFFSETPKFLEDVRVPKSNYYNFFKKIIKLWQYKKLLFVVNKI